MTTGQQTGFYSNASITLEVKTKNSGFLKTLPPISKYPEPEDHPFFFDQFDDQDIITDEEYDARYGDDCDAAADAYFGE